MRDQPHNNQEFLLQKADEMLELLQALRDEVEAVTWDSEIIEGFVERNLDRLAEVNHISGLLAAAWLTSFTDYAEDQLREQAERN